MKKSTKDSLIIGFALFAMFFGAGNLIFPPSLGNLSGNKFIIATIGFLLTGVGIPFLGIVAASNFDGSFTKMASRVSPKFALICTTILFLAIGPMLALPRTAATTFEMAIRPMFGEMSPLLFSIIYFAINLIIVFKPTKLIDIIGTYLTPVLLIALTILIVKGCISPIGVISAPKAPNILSTSLKQGYQTMDALASLIFATIIISAIAAKGYKGKDFKKMTLKSGAVAILALALVYGGLMYLGSQTSSSIGQDMQKTELLLTISKATLGSFGTVIIGICIGVACLSTSIGLLSSGATFFEECSKGKLPYKVNAIVISAISIVIGSLGVDKIVKLSIPVLSLLYPVAITLIITSLLKNMIKNDNIVKLTVYTSLIFSIIDSLQLLGIKMTIIDYIPLGSSGFVWVLPVAMVLIISMGCYSLLPTLESNKIQ